MSIPQNTLCPECETKNRFKIIFLVLDANNDDNYIDIECKSCKKIYSVDLKLAKRGEYNPEC